MGKILVQCLESIEPRKTKHPFKLAIFSGVATCRFREYSLNTVYKFRKLEHYLYNVFHATDKTKHNKKFYSFIFSPYKQFGKMI